MEASTCNVRGPLVTLTSQDGDCFVIRVPPFYTLPHNVDIPEDAKQAILHRYINNEYVAIAPSLTLYEELHISNTAATQTCCSTYLTSTSKPTQTTLHPTSTFDPSASLFSTHSNSTFDPSASLFPTHSNSTFDLCASLFSSHHGIHTDKEVIDILSTSGSEK